jgi:hypothetical protein
MKVPIRRADGAQSAILMDLAPLNRLNPAADRVGRLSIGFRQRKMLPQTNKKVIIRVNCQL